MKYLLLGVCTQTQLQVVCPLPTFCATSRVMQPTMGTSSCFRPSRVRSSLRAASLPCSVGERKLGGVKSAQRVIHHAAAPSWYAMQPQSHTPKLFYAFSCTPMHSHATPCAPPPHSHGRKAWGGVHLPLGPTSLQQSADISGGNMIVTKSG